MNQNGWRIKSGTYHTCLFKTVAYVLMKTGRKNDAALTQTLLDKNCALYIYIKKISRGPASPESTLLKNSIENKTFVL